MTAVPTYSERYVAMIDVLGVSALLAASDADESLAQQAAAVATVVGEHVPFWQRERERLEGPERESAERLSEIARAYAFSDTIAISGAPNANGLGVLLDNSIIIVRKLLQRGVLCRGGIVRGKMFERYDAVSVLTGPAVLRAHKIEQEVALYPRIVLEKQVRQDCELSRHPKTGQTYVQEYLATDRDGRHMLDYLPCTARPWREKEVLRLKGEREFMKEVRARFLDVVARSRAGALPVDVSLKLEWFAQYFDARAGELGMADRFP